MHKRPQFIQNLTGLSSLYLFRKGFCYTTSMPPEPMQSVLLYRDRVAPERIDRVDALNVQSLESLYKAVTGLLGEPHAVEPWRLRVAVREMYHRDFGLAMPDFETSSTRSRITGVRILINRNPVVPDDFKDHYLYKYDRFHRINGIFLHEWRHVMDYLYYPGKPHTGMGPLLPDEEEENECNNFAERMLQLMIQEGKGFVIDPNTDEAQLELP